MKRALAMALILAACEDEPAPKPAPPPPATRADVAATARRRDECRDNCEQAQIVAGNRSDADLRACRARCDGQYAPAPVEAPSKITVAPAKSAPPAVKPR